MAFLGWNKRYLVVKTTPEKDRFSSTVRQTYKAISHKKYVQDGNRWHDRIYCGLLLKDHAKALAAHLNSGTTKTFRWEKV